MAGHKHITESEATRIWFLHKKGLKAHDIALAVERNVNSVYRVIDVFTKTENGERDTLKSEYGNSNKNLLDIAAAHFGIKQQAAPAQSEKQHVAPDNTVKYLADVLAELRRNNELLEKLCEVWGCK